MYREPAPSGLGGENHAQGLVGSEKFKVPEKPVLPEYSDRSVEGIPEDWPDDDRDVRHMRRLHDLRLSRRLQRDREEQPKILDGNVQLTTYTPTDLEGFHEYKFRDGSTYFGEWVGGIKVGMGVLQFKDHCCYEGDFKGDMVWGLGRYVYKHGSTYTGQFYKGVRQGFGQYTCTVTGEVFSGEWYEDQRGGGPEGQRGVGTYYWDDNTLYLGHWEKGFQTGVGIFIYPDGRRYVGEWDQGMMHGLGMIESPNGSTSVGQWKHGRFVGERDMSKRMGVLYTAAVVAANEAKTTQWAASLILKKAALVADEAGQRMRLWEQTVKGSEQPAYSVVGPASVLKPPPESLIQLTQREEHDLQRGEQLRLKALGLGGCFGRLWGGSRSKT
mmetsp:Transcript_6908/g.13138  ORF Transcript_6908/g.13138 Transcript_6908/m.13138 type:complete len:384 (-) Transcript_6908:132-1283(-)